MARARFIPDDAGIRKWLTQNMGGPIRDHAEAMAASIADRYGVPTQAVYQVTDRPRGAVIVTRGELLQARDGALTQAAAARGLEVRDDVG